MHINRSSIRCTETDWKHDAARSHLSSLLLDAAVNADQYSTVSEWSVQPACEQDVASVQCRVLIRHLHNVQIQILQSILHGLSLKQAHREKKNQPSADVTHTERRGRGSAPPVISQHEAACAA